MSIALQNEVRALRESHEDLTRRFNALQARVDKMDGQTPSQTAVRTDAKVKPEKAKAEPVPEFLAGKGS